MRNPHSDINDLVTLDPELYRNLMFLRDYEGDFSDLALTFTTADNDVGQNREVSCVPTLLSDWSMTPFRYYPGALFPFPPPSLLTLPSFLAASLHTGAPISLPADIQLGGNSVITVTCACITSTFGRHMCIFCLSQ